MINKKVILFLIFIISFAICFSQKSIPDKLFIDGMVSGYHQNTSSKANSKERQIKLEGLLEGVSICVFQDKKTVFSLYFVISTFDGARVGVGRSVKP